MDLLMKLKGALARLSKKKPKRLQKRVNACTSKCDGVLQKFRIEKTELERELESKNASIENLTQRLDFYRQLIRSGKGENFFSICIVY
jgi:predicted RNase H-like nuclease (RuvC/YqgF family)